MCGEVYSGWYFQLNSSLAFTEAMVPAYKDLLEDVVVWEEPDNAMDDWVVNFLPSEAYSLNGGMPRLSEDDSFNSQVMVSTANVRVIDLETT